MKRARKNNSIVTEAQLRRLIRDEISRQRLVQEGIFDVIAAPFSKLKEKAKKEVMSQVEKVVAKIKELINNINENIKGKLSELGFNEFLQAFKSTEGSEDIKSLVDDAGFSKELKELIAAKSELKTESLILVKNRLVENKVPTHDEIRLAFSLMEKKSVDRSKKLLEINEVINEPLLTEVVVEGITLLVTKWWAIVKAVTLVLGSLALSCKALAYIFNKVLGKKEWGEKFEHYEHMFHEIEEKALKVLVYPAPVSYAAYVAISKIKKIPTVTYEEFNSKEHEKEKKAAEKILHVAVLAAIIIEAVVHIGHALLEFSSNASDAMKKIGFGAYEVGKEAGGIASKVGTAGATATVAATEV
jgi:hypothetical protein